MGVETRLRTTVGMAGLAVFAVVLGYGVGRDFKAVELLIAAALAAAIVLAGIARPDLTFALMVATLALPAPSTHRR